MPLVEVVFEENVSLKEELANVKEQLAQANVLIDWLKKQMYGGGKGERQDALQLQLKLKELEAVKADLEEQERISYDRTKKKPRCLPADRFDDLPVKEQVTIDPDEVILNPDAYRRIGEETTFEVEITPPKLYKREIIRPKYRLKADRSVAPIVARAKARVIEGSYASAGLISWVLVSKYWDHLPLYRQEKMLKRWGAEIPRQTMSDWVAKSSSLLEVIYWKLRDGLMGGGYIQIDETPVRFVDPDIKKGKSAKGYFWLMGHPEKGVFMHWDRSRGQAVATELLDGFSGLIQTDGYAGYNEVSARSDVERAACLAHCRRKFTEALASEKVAPQFILRLIGNIYHIEKEIAQVEDSKQQLHLKQRDLAPIFALLKKSALLLRERSRPESLLGKACSYLLGQWDGIEVILKSPVAKLDNNFIENAVRPTALGKKNWLFIGAPDAGKRSAVIYSLLLTCKCFNVDPQAYLKDVLERLPAMTNQDDFDQLLPQNWKPSDS